MNEQIFKINNQLRGTLMTLYIYIFSKSLKAKLKRVTNAAPSFLRVNFIDQLKPVDRLDLGEYLDRFLDRCKSICRAIITAS